MNRKATLLAQLLKPAWWFSAIAAGCICFSGLLSTTGPAKASASCNLSDSPPLFGNTTTSTNQSYSISAIYVLNCFSGNANEAMTACIYNTGSANGGVGSSGPYYMVNGATNLSYNVYTDSGYSQPFQQGHFISTAFSLNSSGFGGVTLTLYYRVPAGQTTVPPGNYATTISLTILVGDQSSLNPTTCNGAYTQTWSRNDSVTATNQGQCTVVGGTLNFGSVSLLSANVDSTATITPTCSTGDSYTISLDGGQNGGSSATNRKMVNGTNSILYGLFSDSARTQGWYGASVGATGSGSAQPISVYGRVAPQTTPAPGTYTDTVVITVTF